MPQRRPRRQEFPDDPGGIPATMPAISEPSSVPRRRVISASMPSHMGVCDARAIDVDRDLVWSEFLRDRLAQAAYREL